MTNKEFFIQTWKSEIPRTLSAINGLPKDMSKLNYQCNSKARTAMALLSHMLGHAEVMAAATTAFACEEKSAVTQFASKEEAAAYFEEHAMAIPQKLNAVDDKTWDEQIVDFRLDGNSLFAYPMTNIYWMLLFDMIHHRGQLSTYYRNMGVRNPQIYGPTAEDIEAMMAARN